MKRIYIFAASLTICGVAIASSKLDAGSLLIADNYRNSLRHPGSALHVSAELDAIVHSNSRRLATASAFVKLSAGATASDIENYGVNIIASSNDILLVNGIMDDLLALSQSDAITLMSFSRNNEVYLDKASELSNVLPVHSGNMLPQAYKGSGVICGIFDTGVDINHINFMDSELAHSRVKALYHFNGSDGSSVAYETPERIASFRTDLNSETHGTHTLGCMAGSFNGCADSQSGVSGSYAYPDPNDATLALTGKDGCPYYGMAPDADIVACAGELDDANVTAAVDRITSYAAQTGQPAVINLSLGSILGPRDGSDACSQFLTGKTSDAIIVISAGNDGAGHNTISRTLTSGDNVIRTFIGRSDEISGTVDIWASDNRTFRLKAVVYDLTSGQICDSHVIERPSDDIYYLTTSNYTVSSYHHSEVFDKAFANSFFMISSSANQNTNRRYNCTVSYQFTFNAESNSKGNLVPAIIIEGIDGQRIDIANISDKASLTSRGIEGWTEGGSDMSINNLATAKNIIAVGAYTSRKQWANFGTVLAYNNPAYQEGHICPFSSHGTTVEGISLPHVCAPGAAIVSSYSSFYVKNRALKKSDLCASYTWNGREHQWGVKQGTSMSAPIVAGIVAMWLEADPNLTPADIHDVIAATSARPAASDGDNDMTWGAGAIDALAGLKFILAENSVADIKTDSDRPILTSHDDGYELFVPGAQNVHINITDMNGRVLRSSSAVGDTACISTAGLCHGIYIISADSTGFAQRIAIR